MSPALSARKRALNLGVRGAALALASLFSFGSARARADELPPPFHASPFAPLLREQYYQRLAKSPWRAFGYELLLPGAGNAYVGLYPPGIATLGATLLGAGLWIAGSVRERPALTYAGMGTFAAARAYGLVSAPVTARLLNRAYRRQLRFMF